MNYTGINMEDVKKRNRTTILGIIARNGSVSRKQISEITGLTPASVTLLCNEMIAQGLLLETGTFSMNKGAGRKQILLELNGSYCTILSVNIESENTFIVLTDLKNTLLDKRIIQTERGIPAETFLKMIASECQEILEDHPDHATKLAGVSVCVPGVVNKKEGISVRAFGVWEDSVPVCKILHECLRVPVIIENNVNALAFAQIFYENAVNKNNFLLIKWGPGVGSALVIHQQVYQGRGEMTAELGHVVIDKNGRQCSCGKKGCLETYVSLQALTRIMPIKDEDLESAYTQATDVQRKAVDEALDIFARSITNVVTLLAPDQVILCGKLFHSRTVRQKLISLCHAYNPACTEKTMIYTEFENKEEYIGPSACYIQNKLFQI